MSARFRILITDRAWPDASIEQAVFRQVNGEVFEAPSTDEAQLIRCAADADAILTNWARVTARVIQAARRCRVISRFGIGIDNIAVEAATAQGIAVTNCPDYCVSEVSDHTLGLLLALARRIGFFHLRTKRGEYNLQAAAGQQRLSTQTLGVVGLGPIGREVARKARLLGMQVVAHTASGRDYGLGCPMLGLRELLAQADYVSLHAPLTPATHHLLGHDQFRVMKPGAYLINTSRGALVDENALWEALQQGRLAGAALDVFDPEPPDLSRPLFQDERVIVTPHAAFVSRQAVEQMRRQAAEQAAAVLAGQRPQNVLNPQIYALPAQPPC
jgi:D-3-phosphoglycerate dehydrogenase